MYSHRGAQLVDRRTEQSRLTGLQSIRTLSRSYTWPLCSYLMGRPGHSIKKESQGTNVVFMHVSCVWRSEVDASSAALLHLVVLR